MKPRLSPPIAQKLRQDTKPFTMNAPSPHNQKRRLSATELIPSGSSPLSHRSTMSTSKGKMLFPTSPKHAKKAMPVVGLVNGETSTHFLVRFKSSYVPVRKASFVNPVTSAPFTLADIKGKKVQITGLDTPTPIVAYLSPDTDLFSLIAQLETDTSFLTTDRDATFRAEDELERQTSFNLELLGDIVALTSLAFSEERSKVYAKNRLPSIREDLKAMFAVSGGNDIKSTLDSEETCKHLMSSMEFSLSDTSVVCSDCKVAVSRVQLSCGHSLCPDCCKELIVYTSGSELKLLRCPACKRTLTTTDARLILLERYHILKKGLKYAEAFGVEKRV